MEKETNALANYEAHIVAKFAGLYVIGRRFANMFSIKATEACLFAGSTAACAISPTNRTHPDLGAA